MPCPATTNRLQSHDSARLTGTDHAQQSAAAPPGFNDTDHNPQNSSANCTPPPLLLPPFTPAPPMAPHCNWSPLMSGNDFCDAINAAYEEIVHWKQNLFSPPSGKAGKAFTQELSNLYQAYGESSALEPIALKAAMVLPSLLLQKPYIGSKPRDHCDCLTRRLSLWHSGDINNLMLEARAVQHRIKHLNKPSNDQNIARLFSNLMFHGKVKEAIRLLSTKEKGAPLNIHSAVSSSNPHHTVLHELQDKHPPGKNASPEALIQSSSSAPLSHPVIFDQIQGCTIRSAALNTNGAAGPSGLDAAAWRRLCTSFHKASNNLCNSLALVAKKLCTTFVDPNCLSPFTACRLIALDKSPGVRPIGVCEVVRRICSKAILSIIRPDILKAAGTLQLCAGQEAGCEAAVHALRRMFDDENTEGVLLVDASNAFNNLNRQAALHNVQLLCPPLASILINTYRTDAQLFIDKASLLSKEGTTQGDPLAMPMFALASIPLINNLKSLSCARQVWYADDAAAAGKIKELANWWSQIRQLGPSFGYFVNPAKTCLVVKEKHLQLAIDSFSSSGIQISCEGARYLGAPLGTAEYIKQFISQKVSQWQATVESLSSIATSQPHAAYSAMTHGVISQWLFLQRTIPNLAPLLQSLEESISQKFIPALTGRRGCSDLERELFALPVRLGGLGLTNPVQSANQQHSASLNITSPLTSAIANQDCNYSTNIIDQQLKTKQSTHRISRQLKLATANSVKSRLDNNICRAVTLASEKGASSWLTALPIEQHGFALHKRAFRDALSLRYNWPLSNLPTNCVCGKPFSVDHALCCPTGGFPSIRHNELRDLTANAMTEVCHDVCIEPNLQPLSGESLRYSTSNKEDGARLDIRAAGFWGDKHQQAYFDVRVFNPNACSYRHLTLASAYSRQEKLKRRHYEQRVTQVEHGSFTPLVFSTTGGLGNAADVTYKRLASLIASKREVEYATIRKWLRNKISFSLLRSAITCLRGSRSSYHSPQHDLSADLIVAEAKLSN